MNTDLIKKYLAEKGYTIHSMSKELKLTHAGLARGIQNDTIKVKTLIKMANKLKITPAELLSEVVKASDNASNQRVRILRKKSSIERLLKEIIDNQNELNEKINQYQLQRK